MYCIVVSRELGVEMQMFSVSFIQNRAIKRGMGGWGLGGGGVGGDAVLIIRSLTIIYESLLGQQGPD